MTKIISLFILLLVILLLVVAILLLLILLFLLDCAVDVVVVSPHNVVDVSRYQFYQQ